jgi:plasmid stabilization system protein ParE
VKLVWSAFALADRDGIFTHIEAALKIAMSRSSTSILPIDGCD